MRFATRLFLIVFILPQAYAFELSRQSSQLILRDDTCSKVQGLAEDLRRWSVAEKGKETCKILSHSFVKKDGQCSFDVTNCVPEFVFKYHGLDIEDGPNCFNFALVAKGILPNLRYSSTDEISFYMKPPLCRPLMNSEARKAGDVGTLSFLGETGSEFTHAFIYISDQLAYDKPSNSAYNSRSGSYRLTTLDQEYNRLGGEVSKDRSCRQNEFGPQNTCEVSTAYYRCISMDEYLKDTDAIPGEILSSFKEMQKSEACLQARLRGRAPLSEEATRGILNIAEVLTKYLTTVKKSDLKDEKTRFLLGGLQLRLDSIRDQMQVLTFSNRQVTTENRLQDELNDKLDPLKKAIHKSLQK